MGVRIGLESPRGVGRPTEPRRKLSALEAMHKVGDCGMRYRCHPSRVGLRCDPSFEQSISVVLPESRTCCKKCAAALPDIDASQSTERDESGLHRVSLAWVEECVGFFTEHPSWHQTDPIGARDLDGFRAKEHRDARADGSRIATSAAMPVSTQIGLITACRISFDQRSPQMSELTLVGATHSTGPLRVLLESATWHTMASSHGLFTAHRGHM